MIMPLKQVFKNRLQVCDHNPPSLFMPIDKLIPQLTSASLSIPVDKLVLQPALRIRINITILTIGDKYFEFYFQISKLNITTLLDSLNNTLNILNKT